MSPPKDQSVLGEVMEKHPASLVYVGLETGHEISSTEARVPLSSVGLKMPC